MGIEQKIHFNYEDGEVKLDFSFNTDDAEKALDQMKRFKPLLQKGLADISYKITEIEQHLK